MAKTPERWDVEDESFWNSAGKKIANQNLWISIPNLLLGFAIWIYWGMVIVRMQSLHDANPEVYAFRNWTGSVLEGADYQALLYTLPAVAGLSGATLRITNSFMIAICGGRNVKAMTTLLLALPPLAAGILLQNPDPDFFMLVLVAAASGVGGGAFASSMSNISFFFPKKMQGLALGLNAGLGNLGVSIMQFLIPWVITFPLFGALSGEPFPGPNGSQIWLQNSGLVWVPLCVFFMILAWMFMTNLPMHKCGPTPVAVAKYLWLEGIGFIGAAFGIYLLTNKAIPIPELLKIFLIVLVVVLVTLGLMRYATQKSTKDNLVTQFAIFKNKHNWIMTWLYVMTFGSFIGYSAAFPKLISDVFGYIRVDQNGNALAEAIANPNAPDAFNYAWLGALVGSLIRPVGGWLSDKLGGARVTHWDTVVMIGSTIGAGYFVMQARMSPTPEVHFLPFLLLFLLLFITTGIGNGSTFRMIPIIFEKDQAGPVLGWTSAIAAYGAFLIPKIFATQIKAQTPEYALYGFAVYYLSCLVVNWWFYARKNAEVPC